MFFSFCNTTKTVIHFVNSYLPTFSSLVVSHFLNKRLAHLFYLERNVEDSFSKSACSISTSPAWRAINAYQNPVSHIILIVEVLGR